MNGQVTSARAARYRYAVLITGMLGCTCVGAIYTYSLFQPYVMDYFSIDSSTAVMPFTLSFSSFVIGELLVSVFQRKVGMRMAMGTGILLIAVGYFLSSLIPSSSPHLLFITYSVITAMGAGAGLNMAATAGAHWFPDHKGTANALMLGMLGGGAALFSPVCNHWLTGFGLVATYRFMALAIFPVALLAFLVFREPPEGFMEGYVPKGVLGSQTGIRECHSLGEIMRTGDTYRLMWLFFVVAPAYFIANAVFVSFGVDSKTIDPGMVALFVSIASVCQIVGRFLMGIMSDRVGRKLAMLVNISSLVVSCIFFIAGEGAVYAVAYALMSFGYGGSLGMLPTLTSDRLGNGNASQNLAICELGTLASSLFSTALSGFLAVEPSILIGGFLALTGAFTVLSMYGTGTRRTV